MHRSRRFTTPLLPAYFVWIWGTVLIERCAFCSSDLRKGYENSPARWLAPWIHTIRNGLRTHCCLSHRFLVTITVERSDPQTFKGIPCRQGLMPYSVRGALVVSQSHWASSVAEVHSLATKRSTAPLLCSFVIRPLLLKVESYPRDVMR